MRANTNNEEELARLRELAAHNTQQLDALRAKLRVVRTERDLLKERLNAFMRKLFAAKSEIRGSEQKDLFFNEAEALAPTPLPGEVAAEGSVEVPAHRRAKRGREPLDAALPREVIRHELSAAERICPHDGAELKEIGIEASEQLDIVPAQVRVIRHERVKYACPCCDRGLRVASAPARLIPKGLLTASALAWVITSKYQDALPLYRQAALLGRFGGEISRNTLAGTVVRVGAAVQPIVNLLRDSLFEAKLIHGDETELQVLKEPGRAAQRKSYLWAQMSGSDPPPIRLFNYAASRSAETAQKLYDGAHGALLTDGYEVYPCMRCMGFITDEILSAEAQQYGSAGGRPQVIWPNGVLASTAVGMFVSMLLPWQQQIEVPIFVEFDGNASRVFPSNRLKVLAKTKCRHFSGPDDVGDPFFVRNTETMLATSSV